MNISIPNMYIQIWTIYVDYTSVYGVYVCICIWCVNIYLTE